MVVRVLVVTTRGGDVLAEVEPARLEWSVQSNVAETVKATFLLNEDRGWGNLLTEWKHSLIVDVGGRLYGGPILPHGFDDDGASLTVTARGLRHAFGARTVRPVAALTTPLAVDGVPDVSLDTVLDGLELGSIAARVGRQACEWPGWTDVPVVWPNDRPGGGSVTYRAVDGVRVADAWDDLSATVGGPDIRLLPRWRADGRVEWLFEAGTAAQPRLQSDQVHAWEPSLGSGLKVTTDPSRMGSVAWASGGRAGDTVLTAMRYDSTLVDDGYPLLELDADGSVNSTDLGELERRTVEALRTAARPAQFWSFNVRADRSPFPFEIGCGDLVDVTVGVGTPVSGGYVPARREPYRRRVAGVSGDVEGEWLTITCGEAYDG